MPARILTACLILLFSGGISSIAEARQQTNQTVTMQQMQQQLLELQKQMEFMKTRHDEEIKGLKEQLKVETVT